MIADGASATEGAEGPDGGSHLGIERITFRGAERHLDLRGPGDWPIMARVLQCHRPSLRESQSLTLSVPPESVTLLPGKFAVTPGS